MYLNSFIVLCYNCLCCMIDCFFFFKQKTAYEMRISDWSSDVCSSDLLYRIADGRLVVADTMRWRPWMAELDGDKLNQLVGKMLADLGGAYSVPTVRIGHRLGLFGSLHDAGPATADELAGRLGPIGRASCRERVCQYG